MVRSGSTGGVGRRNRLTGNSLIDVAQPRHVPITAFLDWAMRETGVSNGSLAQRCEVEVEDVVAWREGASWHTTSQFRHMVSMLKGPTAFFFPLQSEHQNQGVPRSFRRPPRKIDDRDTLPEEEKAVRLARRLQQVTRWIRGQEGCRGFLSWMNLAQLLELMRLVRLRLVSIPCLHDFGHLLQRSHAISTFILSRERERWRDQFAAAFLILLRACKPNPHARDTMITDNRLH
jgi:hypothetical protein